MFGDILGQALGKKTELKRAIVCGNKVEIHTTVLKELPSAWKPYSFHHIQSSIFVCMLSMPTGLLLIHKIYFPG